MSAVEETIIPTSKYGVLRCVVTGAGGFIGGALALRLKRTGHYVIAADIKPHEYMQPSEFCDEFHQLDLSLKENCEKIMKGANWAFLLAANMGGMGFICSNHSLILMENTLISVHSLEAARAAGVQRVFYASSACAYPEHLQVEEGKTVELKESDLFTGKPDTAYGVEKLATTELLRYYNQDFPNLHTCTGVFHNIYGPCGTWGSVHGRLGTGREKFPAAVCRKVAVSDVGENKGEVEIWGTGDQIRTFCYIDDCVEGVLRLIVSDVTEPVNIGSNELVTMNNMARLVATFDNKTIQIKNITGPIGVNTRSSENSFIRSKLNWAPTITLKDGLQRTYNWIKQQLNKEKENGFDISVYKNSKIVAQNMDFKK